MKLSHYVIYVALAACAASSTVVAQEIPYGVDNLQKLSAILKEAKSHLASQETSQEWLKAAGIASHQLATLKVKSASDEAVVYLKKVSEMNPSDMVILAYLGSAYAMLARDSSFVVNKVRYVNKGLSALDKAAKKNPANLTVRIIRGGVSYELPAMFSRESTAQEDYLFIAKAVEAGSTVPPERLSEIYYKLGQLAAKNDQINAVAGYYALAQKAAPQSAWAEKARKASK